MEALEHENIDWPEWVQKILVASLIIRDDSDEWIIIVQE